MLFRVIVASILIAAVAPLKADELQKIPLLPHTAESPRKSEGDFVQLKDGRILFVFSKFTGGKSDFDPSYLAGRVSTDAGRTWSSDDVVVLENEGKMNTMSVSLNRLADGRIALFYARKNSLQDCRPCVRYSSDEAKTWSAPTPIVPDAENGYYVLNNDRVVQLASGRLVVPLAWHDNPIGGKFEARGVLVCYLSDDAGKTWRRGKGSQNGAPAGASADAKRILLQEPGVVELTNGELLMFARTSAGSQHFCRSTDGGETWSVPEPTTLLGPVAPASIERIPSTGDLLCIWNDYTGLPPRDPKASKRTPLKAALSKDEGRNWTTPSRMLEPDMNGFYCYTAIEFVGDNILLGYCASDLRTSQTLADTQITRLPVRWLYETK